MADNYIENKMEEHRNRSAVRYVKITPSGRKPGFALLPFDIKTAIIFTDAITSLTEAIASEIRATGCRVALCCQAPETAKAAQKLSCASLTPTDNALEALEKQWNKIELIIKITQDLITIEVGRGTSTIYRSKNCAPDVFATKAAQLCLYLALPDSIGRVFGNFTI